MIKLIEINKFNHLIILNILTASISQNQESIP